MRAMARRGKIIPFPRRPPQPSLPPAARGLVELRRCDQAEAVVVKSLLESEGIPTLLRSRLAHSVHPFTVGAQGEVIVLVPLSEVERATGLLQGRRGPDVAPTPPGPRSAPARPWRSSNP
jgi:hypothetical protein